MSAAEISDGSISSEGEPPVRRLYRKPCVKKRRFNATNHEHPCKIHGVNMHTPDSSSKTQNSAIEKEVREIINLSSPALTATAEIDSAWNNFIVAYEFFWCCCCTITQVWKRCGKSDKPVNETDKEPEANEVIIKIEDDGETKF